LTSFSSDNKRIFHGLIRVSFFILIVKFIGVFREIAVANRFGVSELVDSYTLSTAVVFWIPAIWTSVVNLVYVPLSNKLPAETKENFDRNLLSIVMLVGLLSIFTVYLVVIFVFPITFTNLNDSGLELLLIMCSGLTPLILFALMSAHLSALLLAKERHINTLTQIVPPIVLILFLLFWPADFSSAYLFIAGMIVGFLLRTLTLAYFCKRADLNVMPMANNLGEVSNLIKNAMGLMVLSQFIASFGNPIYLYFASTLGEGNVSVFGYTTKIIALAVGLGATATGRAVLPVLSNSTQSFFVKKKLTLNWALKLCLIGIVAAIILRFAATDLVRIVFERGAFTSQNTQSVAEMVRFGALQLPFVFSNVVFAQFFASQGAYRVLLYSSCIGLVVMALSSYVLIQFFQLPGLMLAKTTTTIAVNLFFLNRVLSLKGDER